MRKAIYIVIAFGILTSCRQKIKSEKSEIKPTEIPAWKVNLDTILERNNPKNLDLTQHQLFIDTTRNSEIYAKMVNWKPHKLDNDAILYFENEIAKKHKPIKVDLKNFPKDWICLEKLKNDFVIYDPCDGNTTTFKITENSVHFFYGIETDADLIHKLKKVTKNEIVLELRTVPQKTKTEITKLIIEPTEFKNVYLLTYSFGQWYVTPKENISEFDIVVNHCPKTKRREFTGFER